MLLVNVHELEIILSHAIVVGVLEGEVENVGRILGLESENVLVLGGAKHLGERRQVDAKRKVAIAAEGGEGFCLEHHGHEGNMAIVHGLEGDSAVIAVEVAVHYKILNRVDDLESTEIKVSEISGPNKWIQVSL